MSLVSKKTQVAFVKMQGLGNDFLVTDDQRCPIALTPEIISQWSDRHYGVGFDQLLFLSKSSDADVDLNYQIFNADGSKVSQCGNGARCAARYAVSMGLSDKNQIVLQTSSTRMVAEILSEGAVKVSMGMPDFSPASLPFLPEWPMNEKGFYVPSGVDPVLPFGIASMGNPHVVIPVEKIEQIDLERVGSFFSHHRYFPERVNVGFLEIISEQLINLIVYERGVGLTRACGSGACAAMAVLKNQGLVQDTVNVRMQDGELEICWKGPQSESPLYMTGPAEFVFEGKI